MLTEKPTQKGWIEDAKNVIQIIQLQIITVKNLKQGKKNKGLGGKSSKDLGIQKKCVKIKWRMGD